MSQKEGVLAGLFFRDLHQLGEVAYALVEVSFLHVAGDLRVESVAHLVDGVDGDAFS